MHFVPLAGRMSFLRLMQHRSGKCDHVWIGSASSRADRLGPRSVEHARESLRARSHPGATPCKPGSATLPFFGVVPVVLDEKGNVRGGSCTPRKLGQASRHTCRCYQSHPWVLVAS